MKKAYLLIAFATLMFSSMEIALKMAGASFNPIQLNLIRFFYWGFSALAVCDQVDSGKHRSNAKTD